MLQELAEWLDIAMSTLTYSAMHTHQIHIIIATHYYVLL